MKNLRGFIRKSITVFVTGILFTAFLAGFAFAKDTIKPVITNYKVTPTSMKTQSQIINVKFNVSETSNVKITIYRNSGFVRDVSFPKVKGAISWNYPGTKLEGDYLFKIEAADLAGNKADTQTIKAVVDITAPKIDQLKASQYIINDTKTPITLTFDLSERSKVSVGYKNYTNDGNLVYQQWLNKGKNTIVLDPSKFQPAVFGNYFYLSVGAVDERDFVAKVQQMVIFIDNTGANVISAAFDKTAFTPGTEKNVFSYKTDEKVMGVMEIYDPQGKQVVYQPTNYGYPTSTGTFEWNGKDNVGTPLPEGIYKYKFTLIDYGNNVTTREGTVTILSLVKPALTIDTITSVFSPDGNYNKMPIKFTIGKQSNVKIQLYQDTTLITTIYNQDLAAGTFTYDWDGVILNRVLSQGDYKLKFTATDLGGNEAVQEMAFKVVDIVAPNIIMGGYLDNFPGPFTFDLTEDAYMTVKVFELVGSTPTNLVKTIVDNEFKTAQVNMILSWDGKNTDGVSVPAGNYQLSFVVTDKNGLSRTRTYTITVR